MGTCFLLQLYFCRYLNIFFNLLSEWCFCGNRIDPANKLPESSCSVRCSGNYSQKCGANHIKSVYETGIEGSFTYFLIKYHIFILC